MSVNNRAAIWEHARILVHEDRVVAVADVHLGRHLPVGVIGRVDPEMVVGRPVEVLSRADRQKLDTPLAVGHHLSAEGPRKEVVAAAAVRLPGVDHCMPNRLALGVLQLQDN